MPRRPRHGLADRLRAQEQRATTNRHTITLDDGTTATVPGRACLDVPVEALAILRARDEGAEPPEASRMLRLFARATDPGDAVIWGAAAQFARLALDADLDDPDRGGADG
ncbi:hypothetical protein GO001_21230 [Streptomyces sp. NRRL B-1677]|uniref:hypothetical protein n=1 Tax=Streptomyces sp. NRRL B-1677 TaxID=2682966 RepID=UPI001892A6E3|nr:hypothetical protein [Streptomyces sp. NRRL B-1677]MBF6047735.1 hypothetical protein [Streptomyces sp. NRRL B-1677]